MLIIRPIKRSTHEKSKLTAEDKAWFEDKLASLPPALTLNIVRVTIGDEPLSASRTSSAIGVANSASREIKLNYSQMASREELLRIFIHELSHVVDYRTYSPQNIKLNHTNEFTKLFDVINPPITESSKTVAPYYQDAREEVWPGLSTSSEPARQHSKRFSQPAPKKS